MVVVGRWRHKGGSHWPHPVFIFQTIFISNNKKGNLGNQWQSSISSLFVLHLYQIINLLSPKYWRTYDQVFDYVVNI